MPTVTFDDLITGADGTTTVPNAYQGLYWTGFTAYDDATYHPGRKEGPSFRHGTTSGDQAAFLDHSGNAPLTAEIAAQSGAFTLQSAEVTPGKFKMLYFDVYGYQGSQLVYHEYFKLHDTRPFHLTFDMENVTRVVFSQPSDGPRIIMDDIVVSPSKAASPMGAFSTFGEHDAHALASGHGQLDHLHAMLPVA